MPNRIALHPLTHRDIEPLVDLLALKTIRIDLGYYTSDHQADAINLADFKRQAQRDLIDSFDDSSRLVYTIRCDDQCIGEVSLFEWDKELHRAQLLMYIDPNYQSLGYGKTALTLFLKQMTAVEHLHRLEVEVFGNNAHALRLYESVGFHFEGIRKDASIFNDCFIDIYHYAWLF